MPQIMVPFGCAIMAGTLSSFTLEVKRNTPGQPAISGSSYGVDAAGAYSLLLHIGVFPI
jgi:hypothetical protein